MCVCVYIYIHTHTYTHVYNRLLLSHKNNEILTFATTCMDLEDTMLGRKARQRKVNTICCCQVASVVSDSVRPHRRQPPGSPIPGILQARTLEWVAISFSNAGKWKVKVKSLSCVQLFVTPWTAAYQAPPSMGYCRQEYWSGVPLPSPNTIYHRLYVGSEKWNRWVNTTKQKQTLRYWEQTSGYQWGRARWW